VHGLNYSAVLFTVSYAQLLFLIRGYLKLLRQHVHVMHECTISDTEGLYNKYIQNTK